MAPTPAELLMMLQELDLEVLRLSRRLDELPEKTAILETRSKLRELSGIRERVDTLVSSLQSEIERRHDEIEQVRERIATDERKLQETTDHRRARELSRELDGLRRRAEKLEMESLEFLERLEKAEGRRAVVDGHLENARAQEADLVERYRSVGGALQQEIAALTARRAQVAARVPPELLARYEQVRSAKGGIGAGRLEGDTCTACRMTLPAERVAELRAGGDIGMCPQCRRLIVVRAAAGS